MRESHISPYRKPLTQLNNWPGCMEADRHVSMVENPNVPENISLSY